MVYIGIAKTLVCIMLACFVALFGVLLYDDIKMYLYQIKVKKLISKENE